MNPQLRSVARLAKQSDVLIESANVLRASTSMNLVQIDIGRQETVDQLTKGFQSGLLVLWKVVSDSVGCNV